MDVNIGIMLFFCQFIFIFFSSNDDIVIRYEDEICVVFINFCDMEDFFIQKIDSVLKGLFLCNRNGVVFFIIIKKVQMDKLDIEECFKKCQELNYVFVIKSGLDVVYFLIEVGEKYIKSKVIKSKLKMEQIVLQIRVFLRVTNIEFRGFFFVLVSLV